MVPEGASTCPMAVIHRTRVTNRRCNKSEQDDPYLAADDRMINGANLNQEENLVPYEKMARHFHL